MKKISPVAKYTIVTLALLANLIMLLLIISPYSFRGFFIDWSLIVVTICFSFFAFIVLLGTKTIKLAYRLLLSVLFFPSLIMFFVCGLLIITPFYTLPAAFNHLSVKRIQSAKIPGTMATLNSYFFPKGMPYDNKVEIKKHYYFLPILEKTLYNFMPTPDIESNAHFCVFSRDEALILYTGEVIDPSSGKAVRTLPSQMNGMGNDLETVCDQEKIAALQDEKYYGYKADPMPHEIVREILGLFFPKIFNEWREAVFTLDKGIEVKFKIKAAHPFLAEYFREIEVYKDGKRIGTVALPDDSGGGLPINLKYYADEENDFLEIPRHPHTEEFSPDQKLDLNKAELVIPDKLPPLSRQISISKLLEVSEFYDEVELGERNRSIDEAHASTYGDESYFEYLKEQAKKDWKSFYSENLRQYIVYEGTGHNRIARDFLEKEIGKSDDMHFHQLVLADLDGDGREEAVASFGSFNNINEYFYKSYIDEDCVAQYKESEQDALDLDGCIMENERDSAYSYLVFFPEKLAEPNQILNMVRHEGGEVVACERCNNMPERFEVIEIEDVDGNGILDVITGAYYQEGETIDLYMLREGRFELISSYSYGV